MPAWPATPQAGTFLSPAGWPWGVPQSWLWARLGPRRTHKDVGTQWTFVTNLIDSGGLGRSAGAAACVGNLTRAWAMAVHWGPGPTQFRNKGPPWTSLMVQRLAICLPVQGARVRSLVREDSICCRATGPVHHIYWNSCTLEPVLHKRSHHCEKPMHHNEE